MYKKRMKEIRARQLEVRQLLEGDDQELDLEKLEQELRDLETEYKNIEKRQALAAGIADGTVPTRTVQQPESEARSIVGMERDQILSTPEYRSALTSSGCRAER